MAVAIRLKRIGTKKKQFYRIVVCNSRVARDSRTMEEIGIYDPLRNPALIEINKDRALFWLKTGARPSETVANIFKRQGIKK